MDDRTAIHVMNSIAARDAAREIFARKNLSQPHADLMAEDAPGLAEGLELGSGGGRNFYWQTFTDKAWGDLVVIFRNARFENVGAISFKHWSDHQGTLCDLDITLHAVRPQDGILCDSRRFLYRQGEEDRETAIASTLAFLGRALNNPWFRIGADRLKIG